MAKVPRGFTRFYVLNLLKERPMTGKEIMDEAERQSEGAWRPSPGLIYPLLGRLLKRELIEETDDGKFTITSRGESTLERYTGIQEQLETQLRIARQLSLSLFEAGRLITEDAIDRIMSVTATAQEAVGKGSKDLQKSFYRRYRAFLEGELERIERMHPDEPEEAEEPS
ncbi:hypothetical protein AC482_05280 [miscellaneous Crenarchaeota group-15 archaeon DG-45]|uniref:Transcription regulator PadR N-terminal domain-containing protein n=1 Tax=miscellaneous Crenarchaeota group-15 archaeon DG-45 TaxID=1685127 RepID=A0A0M0BMU0_9ARCH|nr:MAG: hypothetical protein AC482_05280 [miscellaneous Crenarchaeota group-15 archaeon DG-45]